MTALASLPQGDAVGERTTLNTGGTTNSRDEGGKLRLSLRAEEAEPDLASTIDHLTALPELTGARLATIGFCMPSELRSRR